MAEPVEPIILPPAENPEQEGQWLKATLHHWLNTEFPPEAVNADIAERASQVFVRQRMEGGKRPRFAGASGAHRNASL